MGTTTNLNYCIALHSPRRGSANSASLLFRRICRFEDERGEWNATKDNNRRREVVCEAADDAQNKRASDFRQRAKEGARAE